MLPYEKKQFMFMLITFFWVSFTFICGCSPQPGAGDRVEISGPSFTIIGDVGAVITVDDGSHLELIQRKVEGRNFLSVPLSQVLELAEVTNPKFITFIGDDNHTARITAERLEGSYLARSEKYDWEFVSDTFPINTWIKMIKHIIVEGDDGNSVDIIRYGNNMESVTPGRLLTENHQIYFYQEGSSTKEVGGIEYQGTVFSQRKVLRVKDVAGVDEPDWIMAVGMDGSFHYIQVSSTLEVEDNLIYLNQFDRTDRVPLKGLILDPPEKMVTDLFHDVLDITAGGEKVLAVFVDGLSYHQYEKALEEGIIPNISRGEGFRALTVYPPVTNCGFAAMVTGETPDINGVSSRRDRLLQVPDILAALGERNKKGVFIQGQINIVDLDGEVIMNTDRNNSGMVDDNVLETALEKVHESYDLMLVHFKSLDTFGHSYGPYGKETWEQLKRLDGFIGDMLQVWDGKTIILSDHGMHETEEGGDHGQFLYEDMYFPYVIIEQEG